MQVNILRNGLFLLFLMVFLFSRNMANAQDKLWTVGTAKTVEKGTLEVSVFHPWRYGVTNHFELSVHPVGFLIAPHLQGKYTWIDKQVKLASVHAISYPTLFLRTVGKWDAWDAIEDFTVIPNIIVFRNELITSYMLKKATSCTSENYLLSLKVGIKNGLKWGDSSVGYINKSSVYHHSAIYKDNFMWYVGLDLDAYLTENVDYTIDADFLKLRGELNAWAVEHKAILKWKVSEKFHVAAGYKISVGEYPAGLEFHLLPFADIVLIFKHKKGKEMDLFRKKMF